MITFINVFTIKPGCQQAAFDRIQQVYAEVVKVQPGFVDAHLLRSDDGSKVTAIAHWKTAEALASLKQNPRFQDLHDQAFWAAIERVEPHVYSDYPVVVQANS
ncbi:MAG: antibiotic biosynthesis monooxygenase family protein [Elainellaceae cyanobacterium]